MGRTIGGNTKRKTEIDKQTDNNQNIKMQVPSR